MAEQTFRSPNFYENEIDLSGTQTDAIGTPAGIIGTSDKGPAFVPIINGSYEDFKFRFGGLNPKKFGPYAVREFLKHRTAVTFIRVLGAGANSTSGDIAKTLLTGQVKNAGFVVTGTNSGDNRHIGATQFLVAKHNLSNQEAFGFPMFTDNSSVVPANGVNLVRAMIFTALDTRVMVMAGTASAVGAFSPAGPLDSAAINNGLFKLILSSTAGSTFSQMDGNAGVKIYTASMDPASSNYYGKLLNTDPEKFSTYKHLLYADFAVDAAIASASFVGILSGSTNTSPNSGDTAMLFRDAFGHFDTRFKSPHTPTFISQPFGKTEYDLFKFESCDDGEIANTLYKISITNLHISTNPANLYSTFTVLVRDWNDNDLSPSVLERFPNVTLNPLDDNYIGKAIGDRKISFNFDATDSTERRLIIAGKYPNKSSRIRIVLTDAVENSLIPKQTLPFGFHGMELPKFTDSLTNAVVNHARLAGSVNNGDLSLTGSIVPPIPFRFKVTKGDAAMSGAPGNPGSTEQTNGNYTWGVKFETNDDALNPNISSTQNPLLTSYAKFLGIKNLDTKVTSSGADTFNNNKFTLSRVAFGNTLITDITASTNTHMREAAYIRNGTVDPVTYKINDGILGSRVTLATLSANADPSLFNQFTTFTKFTTFMAGGFDGVNALDVDARKMNDKSSAFQGGGADPTFLAPGLANNPEGVGAFNNTVASYQAAVSLMTDPFVANPNILILPGIREPFVTDYTLQRVQDNGFMIYLFDLVKYDTNQNRLFDDSTARPDVNQTITNLSDRTIDNNYAATYFPDVFIDDPENNRKIKTPASIAALAAIAFNDRVSYPWFAPAGFNRAALDFVSNVETRLNTSDRDALYDARINPIATFPGQGFVVWGQKTLQQDHTALDRVNVRRMLLEVKRIIVGIANKLVFEQNVDDTRQRFIKSANTQLGLVKTQAGIDGFAVVMDATNNSQDDIDNNRLNGTIQLIPTRTAEYIAINFIIASSGVQFV